ncbi:MAG: hypothetical protein KQJ78_18835 [Deltaproteobacteria bacterium]|nr:hypothetical protein [Deltaproteobacteria bacterium]
MIYPSRLTASLAGLAALAPAASATADTLGRDILDIRGPLPLEGPAFWPWAVGVAVILALGGIAAWLKSRRQVGRSAPGPTPLEKALSRLARARDLMDPDRVRVFTAELADILRFYLEEILEAPSSQLGSQEYLVELALLRPAGASHVGRDLGRFLRLADLVHRPGRELTRGDLEALWAAAHRVAARAAGGTGTGTRPSPAPASRAA